jgi:hypothetical protein
MSRFAGSTPFAGANGSPLGAALPQFSNTVQGGSMRVSVRKHDNLRPLCDVVVADADYAKLLKPPPLHDHLKAVVTIGPDGKPAALIVNQLQGEAHLVEVPTTAGTLRLFPVTGNGISYFATNTPDVALANAA